MKPSEYEPGEFISRDQVAQRFGAAPLSPETAQGMELRMFHVSIGTDSAILSAEARLEGETNFGPAVWDPELEEWDLF